MKKLIISLILLVTLVSTLSARHDVMYVYRNDGIINSFLTADIDSIRYSNLDLDSVVHKENITQEVWSLDSVYRIPLSIIDSVSMITPETVYKPGAVNISSEMRDYIVASSYSELKFALATPSDLMPSVGDKLVNTEGSGGLQTGFLGQVREIKKIADGYLVCCDPLAVTDVFECYYGIDNGEDNGMNDTPTRGIIDGYYPINGIWDPGPFSVDVLNMHGTEISYEKDGNLLIPSIGDGQLTFSLTPKIRSISHLIVNRDYGVNVSIGLYGEYTIDENFALSGSLSGGGDFFKFFDLKIFSNPALLFEVSAESGLFLRNSIKISTKQKWSQKYVSNFHWEYSSKGEEAVNNINTIKNVSNTHSGTIALKGIYEGGVYISLNVACIFTSQLDLLELGPRIEAGIRFEGTALPYISNVEDAIKSPDLYNMMKGEGVETSLYYGVSAAAKFAKLGISWPLPGEIFGKKKVLDACYYVPEFENTKLQKNGDGSFFACTDVSGKCGPVDIGFSLQNKNDYNDRVDSYSIYDYRGPQISNYSTFFNKPSNDPYIVYPLVKYDEIEMIAEPSAEIELCPDEDHPHLIDLGLPSGTLWYCCNEGASSPTRYGNYYAWGETSHKASYRKENYEFHHINSKGKYVYDDTSYDWAPSQEQVNELLQCCVIESTVIEGTKGDLLTGPNGNSIFLPYAGAKSKGLYGAGTEWQFWTNKLDTSTVGNKAKKREIPDEYKDDDEDEDEGHPYAFDWKERDLRYIGKTIRRAIK